MNYVSKYANYVYSAVKASTKENCFSSIILRLHDIYRVRSFKN